jgi:hypothetical protein
VIDHVLNQFADNPRLRWPDRLRAELLRRIPQMREQLQALLAPVAWPSVVDEQAMENGYSVKALGLGPHFEVKLKSAMLQWKGVADLIELRQSNVLIVDFKTGEPSPRHADQVRIYALLWFRDNEVNPLSILATELKLSYPRGNVSIPAPDKEQLRAIQSGLVERTKSAEAALQAQKPNAYVGPEACPQCDVRHLCSEYWTPTSRRLLRATCTGNFDDIELQVQERVGEYSWLCKCSVATHLPTGSTILLRAESEASALANVFETGGSFRVLGALISCTDDEGPVIASVLATSEIFRVPPGHGY